MSWQIKYLKLGLIIFFNDQNISIFRSRNNQETYVFLRSLSNALLIYIELYFTGLKIIFKKDFLFNILNKDVLNILNKLIQKKILFIRGICLIPNKIICMIQFGAVIFFIFI